MTNLFVLLEELDGELRVSGGILSRAEPQPNAGSQRGWPPHHQDPLPVQAGHRLLARPVRGERKMLGQLLQKANMVN